MKCFPLLGKGECLIKGFFYGIKEGNIDENIFLLVC